MFQKTYCRAGLKAKALLEGALFIMSYNKLDRINYMR